MSRRIARLALATLLVLAIGAQPALGATAVRLTGYTAGPPPKGIAPFAVSGFKPEEAVLLDYDDDRIDDLAMIGVRDDLINGAFYSYMNGGSGFTYADMQWVPILEEPIALTPVDLDHDGVQDLAWTGDDGNMTLYYMGSDGANTSVQTRTAGASELAALRLDGTGDQEPDIVVTRGGTQDAFVFKNTAGTLDGGAAEALGTGTHNPMGVAGIHANNDVWEDIAVLCNSTNQIRFLANQPALLGINYEVSWTVALPATPTRMIVEDLNEDGLDDIAVTMPSINQIRLLFNQGAAATAAFTSSTLSVTGADDIEVAGIDADWQKDLVVHCTDQKVRVLRGNGSGGFSLAATYSVPFQAGRKPLAVGYVNDDFKVDIAVTDKTNDRVVFIQNTSAPSEYRIDGKTRYETAVNISRASFGTGDCDAVVLATATNFPDALTGAPLAAAWNGPILLTPQGSLPSIVGNEIKRIHPKKVFILGGYAAVSQAVESSVKALGYTVVRLAGTNRYETAYKIGLQVKAANPGATRAYVCTGDNFPDALSASAAAAMEKAPILLVTKNGVPAPTAKLKLAYPTLTSSFVVGGTGVVSDTVKAKFPAPTRLAGANRYETSAKVVAWTKNLYGVDTMTVATGLDFPDALGGGAVAPDWSTPLLLVPPTGPLPQAVKNVMGWWGPSGSTLRVLGGTSAVPNAVVQALMNAS